MGNSIASKGAQVSVQLNQGGETICGGSKLSGTVYLNVEKDSITADSLNVKFYGHESTKVQYTTQRSGSDGKTETETHYAYQQHQLVCVDYVLCNNYIDGRVQRGSYEYPFEITLPDFLPGKQGIKMGSDWFVIEYFLEARLHRKGMMTWDVKNSQELLLADKPHYSTQKIPSFIEPISRPVYFCCCYKTGTMTLLANVDTTNVFVNDVLKIEYAARNDSTSSVKGLKISVLRIERFHAQGHDKVKSTTIYQQRIENKSELLDKKFPDSSVESLRKAVQTIGANIPDERPSYHGYLGNVSYFVEVRVETPMCSMNPEVTIPIVLLRNRANFAGIIPEVEVPFALPVDWQATKAPLTELYLPPPTPSAPPINAHSLSTLINDLKESNQWTESTVLKDWLTHGSTDELLHDLGSVFRCIRGEYSYTAFPKIIGEATEGKLSCKYISNAARVVPDMHKAAVCYNFARYCIDKHNARVEFESVEMTTYAHMGVLLNYE